MDSTKSRLFGPVVILLPIQHMELLQESVWSMVFSYHKGTPMEAMIICINDNSLYRTPFRTDTRLH